MGNLRWRWVEVSNPSTFKISGLKRKSKKRTTISVKLLVKYPLVLTDRLINILFLLNKVYFIVSRKISVTNKSMKFKIAL